MLSSIFEGCNIFNRAEKNKTVSKRKLHEYGILVCVFLFWIFLCQLLIAAVFVSILIYTVQTKFLDVHILLCTFGFHFLSTQAILNVNSLIHCSSKELVKNRIYAHAVLQLLAIIFIVTGTIIVGLEKRIHGPHGLSGLVGSLVSIIAGVTGTFRLLAGRKCGLRAIHVLLGLFAFILSSVCFLFGVVQSKVSVFYESLIGIGFLSNWVDYIFVVVVSTYTFCITVMCLEKFIRLRLCKPCVCDLRNNGSY